MGSGGIFDEIGWQGLAQFEWKGQASGKVWASFAHQTVEQDWTGAVFAPGQKIDGTGYEIGGKVGFGGFEFLGTYFWGEGLGEAIQFANGHDALGGERDSDGFLLQGTYKFGEFQLGLSYGQSSLGATACDQGVVAVVRNTMRYNNPTFEHIGSVKNAEALLSDHEPFLVISADIWTDYPLSSCTRPLAAGDVGHFVLVANPDFHIKGDFGLQAGRVTDAPRPRYTYANIGVFHPAFFADCAVGRFELAPLMYRWVRAGRIRGELYQGTWHNVGTPAQLAELDRQLHAT